MMSNAEPMPCPICEEPLKAHAQVVAAGGDTFVASCAVCGRYALGAEEMALAKSMGSADRFNLMALLEVRSIPAEADGTVVLQPKHFKKGWR